MLRHQDILDGVDSILSALYDNIEGASPWSEALERLRALMVTNCTCLRLAQKGGRQREHLFAAGPMNSAQAVAEWESRDMGELGPVPLAQGEHCVVDWSSHRPDPALAEMLRRYDTRQMLTLCIDRFGDVECFLNCDRGALQDDFSTRDVEIFRMVGAHFGRAIRLRRTFASYHVLNQVKSEALDRLATAIFIVTPIGEVRAVNGSAEKLIEAGDCFHVRGGMLHVRDGRADRVLQDAVRSMTASDGRAPPQVLSIEKPDGKRASNLLVVAAPTVSLLTNRPETCVLMFVRDDIGLSRDDGDLLRDLFSLTPAEANVAVDLANGCSIDDISRTSRVSRNTVRAHLRSIFLKTGLRRQADIVHVLTHSVIPLGRRAGEPGHFGQHTVDPFRASRASPGGDAASASQQDVVHPTTQ